MTLAVVYPGRIAAQIKKLLNMTGYAADQHQGNGAYAVHQLRARIPGDDTVYRIIVAPADAPLQISGFPIDQHFIEPIDHWEQAGDVAARVIDRIPNPSGEGPACGQTAGATERKANQRQESNRSDSILLNLRDAGGSHELPATGVKP